MCACPAGFTGSSCEINVATRGISHRTTTEEPLTTSWPDIIVSSAVASTLKSVKTSAAVDIVNQTRGILTTTETTEQALSTHGQDTELSSISMSTIESTVVSTEIQDINEKTNAITSAPDNTTSEDISRICQRIQPMSCHYNQCPTGQDGRIECKIHSNSTFNCTCRPGYIGVNCSCEIDECGSSPCGEGQICIDTENAYFCVPTATSGTANKSSTSASSTTKHSTPTSTASGTAPSTSSSTSASTSTAIQSSSPSAADRTDAPYTHSPNADSAPGVMRDILIALGVILFAACIPLALVLRRYYKAKNKLRASRRAYQTEHELVERMSSSHFTNPASRSEKGVPVKLHGGGTAPPPISPRPIISLPAGTGPENDIYAEYVYIDGPRANRPSFGNRSAAGKGPTGSSDYGEYIYVVDAFGNGGNGIGGGPPVPKAVGPLPSAPPPTAGEYIYFDQSLSAGVTANPGQFVEEPTKPVPPVASVRPLPLEPPSLDLDTIGKGNENVYEELPEGGQGDLSEPKLVDDTDIELDNDLYLKPQNTVN
ncbi:uncharacterized protein LOC121420194 [Lytechinus variegatus]|uniref:uncharacterized protein LOC121420194 n=1 Tax=Lytechinus variegatus TaxID=7654 RepID=UPI001BB1BE7A|nr:uncharacterized protein LOC121420194 [Lytechinus variegatus]